MGEIINTELQSSTEYFSALFITKGNVYDLVFARHNECNLGWESKELVNVQERGEDIGECDPLWKEIEKHLSEITMGQPNEDVFSFSLQISRDWLDAMQSLIENVLAGSRSTSEEMVETAIFSQIQEQLHP